MANRIVGIESEIEELRFREEQLAQRLTENHPDYRELIDRRTRLETRLEEMRVEATKLPPLEQELLRLTQAQERAIEIERQLSARAEQLGVVRASTVSNVHMLEPAEAASHIGPNRTRPLQLGGLAGLVLGIGFVLGLNFMRRGIDDSRSIEEMGLSLFATINRVIGLRTGGHSDPNYALARTMPSDIVVESLRGLRTGLQFSLASAERKSLMITSPAPSLGKSFVSYNLALVSAQAGGRILLIDADMRKGKLRRQFKQSKRDKGLSELLSRSATIEEVLVTDPDTGLDFIGSGKYPPNPADLLTSAAFDQLMRDASDAYDLVIIDTPPVLAVTDPGIIGQKVGMSLLVVKHLETTRAEILSTVKILDTSGVKLSGAILNQFDAKASRYGHYGHKYGYYGGYKYGYD
jgi:tyrosine-protein kinase Etk/Wzc